MKRHPIFARFWIALAPLADRCAGVGEHRDEMLDGVAGRVIEVGAGIGSNFARYPATVTGVLAVEPEPTLRARAAGAAARAPVPVEVVEGVAERLPAPDSSFDVAVASLVLCSVADQDAALAEIRRVLRPGGELRFFEHVLADDPRRARWQRGADRVWPRIFAGCHTSRDTPAAIARAGFEVRDLRRFTQGPVVDPVAPHVIGRAIRV